MIGLMEGPVRSDFDRPILDWADGALTVGPPVDVLLRVERDGAMPIREQVYGQLRAAIVAGQVRQGDRLPPSRRLAAELGVARLTVVESYEQLVAEGYAEARQGSGTFVAVSFAPGGAGDATRRRSADRGGEGVRPLSAWAERLAGLAPPFEPAAAGPVPEFDFRPGVGAWSAIAWARWRRLAADVWRDAAGPDLWYGDPLGPLRLRRALASWLARSRAVRCRAEQIAITSGSLGAVSILARLLLDPGDAVCLEEPGYARARLALEAAGAAIRPIPVDAAGLRVDALPRAAKLVYVTPSHQYPLGVTLTLARRHALLAWARSTGALVVEDDYDGELHLAGHRLESLQGLDGGESVAYVGTFSKSLFPSLRLGYVVLPPWLVEPFAAARGVLDRHPPVHEALVLARFVESGEFERHVHRLRRLYRHRRDTLERALRAAAPSSWTIGPCEAGGHLTVRLPAGADDTAIVGRAARNGAALAPLSAFCLGEPQPGLVFGFGGVEAERITEGVRRIGVDYNRVEHCF